MHLKGDIVIEMPPCGYINYDRNRPHRHEHRQSQSQHQL